MFCGGISGDRFMELVEAPRPAPVIPTDKDYKVYVVDQGVRVKFYFEHLTLDQKQRLVTLMRAGELRFSPPGYFYVLPNFIRISL
jgi:hypothetical protein